MMTITELHPLETLEPIDLAELVEAAALQTRRDRKYLVPTAVVADVIASAPPGTRALQIDGIRGFRYESTYFDTDDYDSYLRTARRRPNRFKVRTRSYVDTDDHMLEVKTRDRRGRTVKHRQPLASAGEGLSDVGRQFIASVDHTLPVDRLRPILTTAYRRATLLLPDAETRVTIDVDMQWRCPRHRTQHSSLAIVETKTANQPSLIDRSLWALGHRPTTISKYCTGLALLEPDLPANRWHRILTRHLRPENSRACATA
jgi:hypothetical protein